MKKISLILIVLITSSLLNGCVYHGPVPYYASTSTVSKFDQSWSAAVGAFSDQGVNITSQDRGTGIIKGSYNDKPVSGDLRRQADGSVRVQFDTSGNSALINGITNSYNSRMGR